MGRGTHTSCLRMERIDRCARCARLVPIALSETRCLACILALSVEAVALKKALADPRSNIVSLEQWLRAHPSNAPVLEEPWGA
jgi:hypothetical protein